MENILSLLEKINTDPELPYIILRTICIYVYAVLLIRFGNTRFKLDTPMDFIFIVILGSILGGPIYGGASLFAAATSALVLVLLAKSLAFLAYQNRTVGFLVKGEKQQLIVDGKINWENMKTNQITKEDLLQQCRSSLNHTDLNLIKNAFLERNGKINFVE